MYNLYLNMKIPAGERNRGQREEEKINPTRISSPKYTFKAVVLNLV